MAPVDAGEAAVGVPPSLKNQEDETPVPRTRAALLIILVLVFAASWFGTLDYRTLIKSDEGRYAEIAREMAVTGDWVTPRYNGVKYFEKPVLLYWTTAAAFKLFGESEWAARLWVGLTGFAGVLLAFFTGRALFGPTAGLLGAAVLGSSLYWVFAGHVNTTDTGVSFFLQCALCAFLLAFRPETSPLASRRLMLGCWAAMALAVLSKGLIGVVLPALVLAAYVALRRDLAVLSRLHWRLGPAVFLAITLPWFVLVTLRNPEFPAFFFIHEHFGRYTTVEGYNRYGPWWYYIALLPAVMLPWTLALPMAFARAFAPAKPGNDFEPSHFLALWILVIVIFFSVSSSKLPGYVLPATPAIALLAGLGLARMQVRGLFWLFGSAIFVYGLLLLASYAIPFPSDIQAELGAYVVWARSGAVIGITGALAAAIWLRVAGDARKAATVLLFAMTAYVFSQALMLGHESFRDRMSSYALAMEVNRRIDRSQPFYAVRTFDHTLPFYMKKTMTLVVHQDELAFGLSIEPHLGIPTIAEFERRWLGDRRPMAVMELHVFAELKATGLPMREVARDHRRVVVEKVASNDCNGQKYDAPVFRGEAKPDC